MRPIPLARKVLNRQVLTRQVYILPTLFTSGNLVCGTLACFSAARDALLLQVPGDMSLPPGKEPFVAACWLVGFAAFFDFFDGLVARLTRSTSAFGKELDSLSDLVSFGMAPATILYLSMLRSQGWGLPVAVAFVVCGGLRLARYNVSASREEKHEFKGLPIPAAGVTLVSYVVFWRYAGAYAESGAEGGVIRDRYMYWYVERLHFFHEIAIPVLAAALAALMVSTLGYPDMRKLLVRRTVPMTLATVIGLAVLVVSWRPEVSAFPLFLFYALFAPGRWLLARFRPPATIQPSSTPTQG